MELIEGESLSARLSRGPLPLEQALRIAGEIGTALDAAHRLGIVHRDLKPANILFDDLGRAKVADLSSRAAVSDANLASAKSELDAMRNAASKSQEEAVAMAVAKAKADAEAAVRTAAPGSVVPTTAMLSAEVLATKARALDLLAFYLTKLSAGGSQ